VIVDEREPFGFDSPLAGMTTGLIEGVLRQLASKSQGIALVMTDVGEFRVEGLGSVVRVTVEAIDGGSPAETETHGGQV